MAGFEVEKELKMAVETLNKDTIKLMEKCLQELTTTGSPSLDATVLKKFKRLCRESDDYVRYAFLLIMRHLNKKHSEIRLSAFQVADELFNRSHAFREILVTHLQSFLALTTETESERPLPPPKSAANKLKTDALHALQLWYDKYGQGYKKLAVGYNYLKNCKHVDFNDIRAQNQAERQRIENEEKRKQKIMADKLAKVLKEISELKGEIENCMREADSCLQLLLPTPSEFMLPVIEEAATEPTEHQQINIMEEYKEHQPVHTFCLPSQQNKLADASKDVDCRGSGETVKSSLSEKGNVFSNTRHDQESSMLHNNSSSGSKSVASNHNYEISDCEHLQLSSIPADASVCVTKRSEDNAANPASESINGTDGSGKSQSEGDSDMEYDSHDDDDLQVHGFANPVYNLDIELPVGPISVQVTTDNKDVVCSLKDASKLITSNYVPKVTKWLEILGKNGAKEGDIKAAIDLKVNLENIKMKCMELNLVTLESEQVQTEANSDEDEFEEVPEKEGYEPHIPGHLRAEYGLDTPSVKVKTTSNPSTSLSSGNSAEPKNQSKPASLNTYWSLKDRIKSEDVSDPTSLASALARIKNESSDIDLKNMASSSNTHQTSSEEQMTTDVPVVSFGTDLAYWENPEHIEAPSIVKLDSLHRFWTPKENEPEKPSQHDIAAVKNRVFYFTGKFEPVKWKCRAVMPNGKLCERMDRVKCPFHGKIIPRDKDGKPNGDNQPSFSQEDSIKSEIVEENESSELPPWQDPELQREIEQVTGHDLGSARSQKLLDKKTKGKGKGKAKKQSKLTNIKAVTNTSRKRLEHKIFATKSMKRVCSNLDSADYKRVRDKFANQFHYSLH